MKKILKKQRKNRNPQNKKLQNKNLKRKKSQKNTLLTPQLKISLNLQILDPKTNSHSTRNKLLISKLNPLISRSKLMLLLKQELPRKMNLRSKRPKKTKRSKSSQRKLKINRWKIKTKRLKSSKSKSKKNRWAVKKPSSKILKNLWKKNKIKCSQMFQNSKQKNQDLKCIHKKLPPLLRKFQTTQSQILLSVKINQWKIQLRTTTFWAKKSRIEWLEFPHLFKLDP